METPVLPLEHAWHRQRAALRANARLKPPPLVAAGLEIDVGDEGPEAHVGGLVVVFGHFPASLDDLVDLARTRLHLNPDQARELGPVLDTRILALWAWLPGPRQDCYLELDQATGDLRAWLVGPEPGRIEDLDLADPPGQVEAWFLDALVLNGTPVWGGSRGLERLVERFGPRSLLVAAQVSEALDREDGDPAEALELARIRWHRLDETDEVPWADLADSEHPFTAAALGRLALRLGMPRAARALLAAAAGEATVPPLAHFDLGQACELTGDLVGAEDGFARYASERPADRDGWRRLLVCRLRRGRLDQANECLQRYRAHGGDDETLSVQLIAQVFSHVLPADQRARCAGWLCARLAPLREGLVERIATTRFPNDEARFLVLADDLRQGFGLDDLPGAADAALATVLLALPLLAAAGPGDTLSGVQAALVEFAHGAHQHLDGREPAVPLAIVTALVDLAEF